MIPCPFCHQDYVWEVGIRALPGSLCMCFECDTVWSAAEEIDDRSGQNGNHLPRVRVTPPVYLLAAGPAPAPAPPEDSKAWFFFESS
jgi:hypothetical protein